MNNPNNLSDIEQFVIAKVREFRMNLNISQAELAFRLDVSRGFIGKIESHKYPTKYSLKQLNRLAKVFNCSPKDFLPETPL
jgi:transcriptional regulator with XRE-family HTH domain